MTRYIKNHLWQIAAVSLAATVVLMTACGSDSAKPAKDQPPSGVTSAGPGGDTDTKSMVDGYNYTEQADGSVLRTQSGELAQAPSNDAASGTSSSGGAANGLPSTIDRKIIQTATLTLETENVAGKFEDVRTVATTYGGFVASSTFGNAGERQTAAITIRIPGTAYESALNDLRKLGDVKGEQSGANDITEEYTDLESRLRNLQAAEAQYVQFMLRAENIQDVLTVQDRLNVTRAEIEQVQGRVNMLDRQTELATITVHLDPPLIAKTDTSGGDSGPLDVAQESFEASLAVLLGIATVALAVAAFSWWILPLAVIGALLGRRQLRADRARQTLPPTPPAAAA